MKGLTEEEGLGGGKGDYFSFTHLSSDTYTWHPYARHLQGALVNKCQSRMRLLTAEHETTEHRRAAKRGRTWTHCLRSAPSAATGPPVRASGLWAGPRRPRGCPHPITSTPAARGPQRGESEPGSPESPREARRGCLRGRRRLSSRSAGPGRGSVSPGPRTPASAPQPGRPASSTCVPSPANPQQRRGGSTWRRTCTRAASEDGAGPAPRRRRAPRRAPPRPAGACPRGPCSALSLRDDVRPGRRRYQLGGAVGTVICPLPSQRRDLAAKDKARRCRTRGPALHLVSSPGFSMSAWVCETFLVSGICVIYRPSYLNTFAFYW